MSTPAFADSSALVKLYADERDAEIVRRLPLIVVSQLARVEVPAALWKKHRTGELSIEDASVLIAEFEADYFGTADEPARFVVTALKARVLDDAARLAGRHVLRAYDAVQLAGACATNSASRQGVRFAAFDKHLCAAAVTEGIELVSN